MDGGDIWGTVETILVVIVILFLAWYVTRFVGLRARGRAAGRHMRVVDRLTVGNDKALLLVKVGAEYCVIGVTGHEMRLIKTLDPAEAEAMEAEAQPTGAQGAPADMWQGMQSFGARLGMAMRGRSVPRERPKPPAKEPDEQNMLDVMNERIKLRSR
jgi:flagellar biosynthetic protein FliO